jgi:hypothetical protein
MKNHFFFPRSPYQATITAGHAHRRPALRRGGRRRLVAAGQAQASPPTPPPPPVNSGRGERGAGELVAAPGVAGELGEGERGAGVVVAAQGGGSGVGCHGGGGSGARLQRLPHGRGGPARGCSGREQGRRVWRGRDRARRRWLRPGTCEEEGGGKKVRFFLKIYLEYF